MDLELFLLRSKYLIFCELNLVPKLINLKSISVASACVSQEKLSDNVFVEKQKEKQG